MCEGGRITLKTTTQDDDGVSCTNNVCGEGGKQGTLGMGRNEEGREEDRDSAGKCAGMCKDENVNMVG